MNTSFDTEMLELFRAEIDTHLPVLSRGLLALEKGSMPGQEIEAMMRAAHSIKGAARIVGIEPVVRVAHVMEDCFTAARDHRIALSSASVDVLLEGLDALQRICSSQGGEALDEMALQALLAKISAVRDGSPVAVTSAPKPAAPVPAAPANLVAAKVDRDEPGITLPAVWDEESIAMLRRQMLDTLALHPGKIRLDFAHVEKLTAAALAILASFAGEVNRAAPPPVIQVSEASDPVRSILCIAGMGIVFGLESAV